MPRPAIGKLLLAIVFALALITPFVRELFAGDETKYSQVIRETRASGQWFLPTLEGAPFTHKPPLHFWMVGALTFIFGPYSLWAYALPSLVAFALLLTLMFKRADWMAAFICATSLLVWGSAQSARMDVSFTALITLGVFLIGRYFDDGDRRALFLAGLSLAVATLIKGPMAPVIAVVFFALESWRLRRFRFRDVLPALAVMAVLPLLWFVPAAIIGGDAYAQEVLQKQLAGRALGSWVHRSPPWYYLLHAPAFLFPWFGAAAVALVARWREERRLIHWILAVLLPYSLMSSKLDVYMMALVPPVALLVSGALDVRGIKTANIVTLAILLVASLAGLFVKPPNGPEWDATMLSGAHAVLIVMAVLAAVALIVSRKGPIASVVALGLVPVLTFAFVALALMPRINELASPRPLIAALESEGVAADSIALYTCPHLWSRDMPRELERVHYVSAATLKGSNPTLIATSRAHAGEIAPQLTAYHRVASLRMIGKWFDVYRR